MKLSYDDQGAGEPLLLIPGFASGAWSWFRQAEVLPRYLRLLTYDPRGIGRSQADDGDEPVNLSMETFVRDVVELLDELELEKCHILGASFGGFVAQELALQVPERIGKLILSCTSAGGATHVKPNIDILRSFTPDPGLTVGERIRKFIRPAFTDEFNAEHADQVEDVCRLREANEVDDRIYFAQLQAAFTFDAGSRLPEIINQTLVLTGDRDNVVPYENSLHLADKIPDARLQIVTGGSHLFFVENAEAFNTAVVDFINGG